GAGERAGDGVAAERSGREHDDLPVVHVRRQALREIVVAGRGDRRDHDLGAGQRFCDVGGGAREARRAGASLGGERDRGTARRRSRRLRGARPRADRMPGRGEARSGRDPAVARAENRDVHAMAPVAWSSAIFTLEYLSTRARISLVCSPRRGGGATSNPIAPSILTGVPRVCVFPWRGWFISTTIPRWRT